MHYLGGGLILAGLFVDVYLCWVIGAKEELITAQKIANAHLWEANRKLQARIPPSGRAERQQKRV